TFNIALLFAIAALSAMVPLQRNEVQSFPQYSVVTVDSEKVLKRPGSTINITLEANGIFGSQNAPSLKLWNTATESLPWKNSLSETSVGAFQYVADGFYDFQAAVLFTYNAKKTIVPSYWWLYECYPRKLDPATQIFSGDYVSDWQNIVFLPGVVDEACYGKTPAQNPRECRIGCTGTISGTVADNTYGRNLWQSYGGTIGRDAIKARIANFGPLLDGSRKALFYGWSENDDAQGTTTFLTLKRESGTLVEGTVTLNKNVEGDAVRQYYVAYQSIDCTTDVKATTPADECPCPDETAAAYKTDPRAKKGGICYVEPTPDPPKVVVTASGSTRAAWTVIATVLLLPLLSMW
ncbi:MAG: hypothetical protein EZS28_044976, partial [Streblomastix strix]